jgi:hypothetical protein
MILGNHGIITHPDRQIVNTQTYGVQVQILFIREKSKANVPNDSIFIKLYLA